MRLGLLFLIFIFSLGPAFAEITFEDGVFPELITSARGLGMGNAYAARVDDHHAAFYNPAGLGTFRKWQVHLFNMHLETNKTLWEAGTGGQVSNAFSNFTKTYSLDGVRELLSDHKGKMSHARYHFFPNMTFRNLSVGYMLAVQKRATIGVEDDAKFEYADRRDHGPVVSLNIPFMGGVVKVGATLVWLMRREAIGEADADQTFELRDSDYDKGQAYIFTGGTKLTLPVFGLPTFSATLHNMAGSSFSKVSDSNDTPEDIKQNLVLAFGLTPQIGKALRWHLELDYKDALGKYDLSTTRRVSAGMELDIARIMFVRLGYGDGFGSVGIGVKAREFQVDLTTYAVDTTSSEFQGEEDRRFVFSISSGI